MSDEPLHVRLRHRAGRSRPRGPVGRGWVLAVRTVSRHRPAALADGVDWRAADATDPEAATDAAKGASVVYQCLNAPYTQWPKLFPPLQRGRAEPQPNAPTPCW